MKIHLKSSNTKINLYDKVLERDLDRWAEFAFSILIHSLLIKKKQDSYDILYLIHDSGYDLIVRSETCTWVKFKHKNATKDLSLILPLHCYQIHVKKEDSDCKLIFDQTNEQILLQQESPERYEFTIKFSLRKSSSSAYKQIGRILTKFGWTKESGSVTKYTISEQQSYVVWCIAYLFANYEYNGSILNTIVLYHEGNSYCKYYSVW